MDTAVGVKDETGIGMTALYGQIQRSEGEICINAVRESIADDLLCAKVLDDGTIEPAFIGGNVSNVANPCTVGFIEREASREEIGRDGLRML